MKSYTIASILLKHPHLTRNSLNAFVPFINSNSDDYMIKGGGSRLFLLSNPKNIDIVLKQKQQHFNRAKAIGDIYKFLADGIFGKDGQEWQSHRTVLQKALRPAQLEAIWPMFNERFNRFFNTLNTQSGDINIHSEMQCLMLEAIVAAYFVKKIPFDVKETSKQVNDLIDYTNIHNHSKREIIGHLKKAVLFKPQNKVLPPSFYELQKIVEQIYLEAENSSNDRGILFNEMFGINTKEQIKGEICSFLFAGYDTVASLLTWATYELTKSKSLLRDIKKEAEELNTDTPDFLRKLSTTKNFISELLRLYPSVTFIPRIATQNTQLEGYAIKKGDYVFISPFLIHRKESAWADASNFNPNRFLNLNTTTKAKYYIPFGYGKTTCVGNHLAISLVSLGILKLVKNFNFELCNKNYKPTFTINTVLTPKNNLYIRNKIAAGENENQLKNM